MYAAGKIPGSFFKREGRAGEKATLTARMIDRPIRPLFPKGWRYETQLVALPISVDHVNPYEILAMNGASAALMVSNIPFPTPVGAVRIGKVDGNFVVNPSEEDLVDNTDLDLIVAGTDEAILMVEAGANEIPEAEILDALDIAHGEIKKLCALQRELAEKAGKEKTVVEIPEVSSELYDQIKASHGAALEAATQVEDKLERQEACKAVEEQVVEQYAGDPESAMYPEYRANAQRAFDKLEKTLIRERIAIQKKRPDGRTSDQIRPISIEVGVPRGRMARHCSRAGRRRPSAWSRSAPPVRRCGSTRSGWRPPSATSTTTTSPASPSARPVRCADRSGVTSATVRSPSARWSR